MPDDRRAQVKAQLRQAYTLIRADRRAEAFALITPVLAQQPDNIDAWWLAAHAAPTPRESAFACSKVLALKPDHWPAQRMLDEQRRLLALEQPITLKPVRRERRPLKTWKLIILLTLPLFAVAILIVIVNLTGSNLGLPIGGLFSAEYEVPDVGIVDRSEVRESISQVVRTGTLVIGAEHVYHFNAGPRLLFFMTLRFSNLPNTVPDAAVQLLDPSGKPVRLTFDRDSDRMGAVPGLAQLDVPGRYTLRLIGTAGKAQGPYVMQLALGALD